MLSFAALPVLKASHQWSTSLPNPYNLSFSFYYFLMFFMALYIPCEHPFNPRRACAARVNCSCIGFVCLSVSVTLNLTSRVFVRLTKYTTYLTGNEGQKFRTVFSETAPLQS